MTEDQQDSNHVCRTCGKVYSRYDHLKRHIRSHTSKKPHKCVFCGRRYARGDVLKRHYQSCPSLASRGTEVSLMEGKDDRASQPEVKEDSINWGSFSRFRVSQPDDAITDVLTAQSPEVTAAYAKSNPGHLVHGATVNQQDSENPDDTTEILRPVESADPSMLREEEWLDVPAFNNISWEAILLSIDPATSFTFLLQLTSKSGLPEAFGDPLLPRRTTSLRLMPNQGSWPISGSLQDSSSGFGLPRSRSSSSPLSSMHIATSPLAVFGVIDLERAVDSAYSHQHSSVLMQESAHIRSELLKAHAPGSQDSCGRSYSSAAIIPHFFSPHRLEHFLDCYWKGWHPNLPIIHRPRFQSSLAPAALLAAMATVGACHSMDELDKVQSKALYADVEEMVFEHLGVATSSLAATRPSRRRLVQVLQAAYMVIVYQNWDGRCGADRCKARRQRFSQIVEAVQLLGIGTATHRDYRGISLVNFDWERYVEDEEAVRLCNWTFLVDAAFVMFYNIAPRLSLRELVMALPSPEVCFAADSEQNCLFELQKWQYQTGFQDADQPTLYGYIKTFCHSELPVTTQMSYAQQSTISLFAVASAFHVMLFNSDPDLGGTTQYNHIITGLENWRLVWNRKSMLGDDEQGAIQPISIFSNGPESGLERAVAPTKSGFWRHCPEYWLLAYLLVQQIVKTQQSSEADGGYPTERGTTVGLLLRRRSSLSSHDEASQRELHRFMRCYDAGGVSY